MAQYRITLTVKTDTKQPRRGERERQRYRVLKSLADQGESLVTLRSVRVTRVV